ncbi:MAG: LysR substrate-binding domain-containing protein [Pseudomonadota bacterium]|nr:LysR substrate-binding domain-containing protein [Pseudomonadota bacterium]
MLRKAPPLESIEVFVHAAKAGSFRAVARDLALSPSAVSRRIAGLETFLGRPLFDRSGPAPRLNAEGRAYLAAIAPAIAAIRDATAALERDDASGRALRVAASHSFASSWLIRRLPALSRDHGVEVEVIPTRDPDALRSGAADLAIWGGERAPGEFWSEPLYASRAAPVAMPMMADGRAAPRDAGDLAGRVLIGVSEPGGSWDRWFASGAAAAPEGVRRVDYPTQQLAYEAAAAGLGVALAAPLVSEPYIPARGLAPCADPRSIGSVHRLCRLADRRWGRTERRFAAWIRDEAGRSAALFDRAMTPAPEPAPMPAPAPEASPAIAAE